ncbi:MAG: PSD1 and planctomycete cytochrome C domain-containing protein [Planctomycetia bacterium]|nr:PSD1 and planctomycete cytochrome C domain-containing protein [Planctomycetia bacterium]
MRIPILFHVAVAIAVNALGMGAITAEPVRFSRDVLPILSENCFACHGPDEGHREADLRLDTREGALAVISLDAPAESELIARIVATDPDVQMPPPSSHKKPLSQEQVDVLTRWIAEGAAWGTHWAFERPVKIPPPAGHPHPIDAFIGARLAAEDLAFAPRAPPHTLARRLAFDLVGLPPSREQAESLTRDSSEASYERLVDDLLASPHFGERMAMWWLDAARYADTDGFQGDADRTNWPWRDWVVEAFNADMPFDRFTVEQCAGDLLPDATPQQRLATCFHRSHMTNGEGGRDPEESRIDYVIDRTNTLGTLWLGLTVGCCQCHSHKYDPVTHHDYYQLNAFFDSIDETGAAGRGATPYLAVTSPHVARAVAEARRLVDARTPAVDAARRQAEGRFEAWLADQTAAVVKAGGFTAWRPLEPSGVESTEGTLFAVETDGMIQTHGPTPPQDDYLVTAPASRPRVTGLKLEVFTHESHAHGLFSRGDSGQFTLTDVKLRVTKRGSSQVREIPFARAVADHSDDPKKHDNYGSIGGVLDDDPRNGWGVRDAAAASSHTAVLALREPLVLEADEELVFELRQRSTRGDANIGRFRVSVTDQAGPAVASVEPAPLEQLAAALAAGTTDPPLVVRPLRDRLREQFLADDEPYQIAKRVADRASRQLAEAKAAVNVDVMVLAERPQPRTTHVLLRGVWDAKGDAVTPGTPAVLGSFSKMLPSGPATRLDLANWLVGPTNPLTARVIVNHVWQLFFGAGLVRTVEDFGLQGERPTHPDLLDWLAVDFVEHGWDVKRLCRLIVTSRAYRQASDVSPERLARDPDNRLLARGARHRLPSWMLRDQALAVAGLLNPALGGPPVKPWQPAGVWEEMFMGRFTYEPSEGPAQHRRTLYAFWRRAIAPTFLFDSAQRRSCEVRLPRTNTPLQALTLLNDAIYLEAARALAERDRVPVAMFRGVLFREPAASERLVLDREAARAREYYARYPADAAALLDATDPGDLFPVPAAAADQAERATATLVASLILNLDEALTHE